MLLLIRPFNLPILRSVARLLLPIDFQILVEQRNKGGDNAGSFFALQDKEMPKACSAIKQKSSNIHSWWW